MASKTRSKLHAETFKRYNYACANCGNRDFEALHIDHALPLALGGLDVAENLQCLCTVCNSSIKRDGAMEPLPPINPKFYWGEVPKHAARARMTLRKSFQKTRR